MLGYEREALENRLLSEILPAGSRIFYQTHLFPLVRLHDRAEEIYLTFLDAGGSEIGTLLNVRRRVRGDRAENDVAVMRIRERRKYEDELLRARKEADRARGAAEDAARAKSDFVTMMSHEIRTPLNAIGGYADLFQAGVYGPVSDTQRDALKRLKRSGDHVLRLINDLLDLSKLEAGRFEFSVGDVRVAAAVTTALSMVEPQAASKGLALEARVPDEIMARADREKVEQVVLNLLGNAVKFTPPGGAVTVSAQVGDDGSVAVLVRDTGPGIPIEEQERLFDAFVQLRGGSGGGSGLGLAISRRLARGMRGDLTVESEPGEGSTFVLRLPAVLEPG